MSLPWSSKRLMPLSKQQRTVAVAAVAEWMFAMWLRYRDLARPEGAGVARQQLDRVWQVAGLGLGQLADVEVLLHGLVPDEGSNSWINESGYAENALSGIAYAARGWEADSIEEAEWGLRQLSDLADYVVESVLPDMMDVEPETHEELGLRLIADALSGIDDAVSRAAAPATTSEIREEFAERGESWARHVP